MASALPKSSSLLVRSELVGDLVSLRNLYPTTDQNTIFTHPQL